VTIRPFAREKKRFAQKFTDGRTDGQTTDAARLYKLMEWAKNDCKHNQSLYIVVLNMVHAHWVKKVYADKGPT